MGGSGGKFRVGFSVASVAFVFLLSATTSSPYILPVDGPIVQYPATAETRVNNELFPEPPELKPNVNFWVDVYSRYSDNEAIIHDNRDLDIRYEVVDFSEVLGRKTSRKARDRYMEKRKRYYKAILRRLNRQNGKCNSSEECRVAALFAHRQDAGRYLKAAKSIRAQYGLSNRFLAGIETSGLYLPLMREIFTSSGLPLELLALPHVESSFNVSAYSRSGAAGIWQFTRSTGKRYMKINYSVDERRDPIDATKAAAKLLAKNYKDLGSWPLAITAYNHGRSGIMRAKKLYGADLVTIIQKHEGRRFGFASRNFYAEFLAALEVTENPEKYFGAVGLKSPLRYDVVTLNSYMQAKLLTSHFGFNKKTMMALNPGLRRSVWNGTRRIPKGYNLRLPKNSALKFARLYEKIPENRLYEKQIRQEWYFVRRGDSLSNLAKRFRTSVAHLQEANGIGNRHRIYAGQKIQIPSKNFKPRITTATFEISGEKKIRPVALDKKPTIVKKQVKIEQPLKPATTALWPRPSAPVAPPPFSQYQFVKITKGYGVITVQPEETIGHYADWAKVSTGTVRRLNGWSRRRFIITGQRIKIPLAKVTRKMFEENRYEYHLGVFEDFFAAYKIEKVDTHVVRKGQSLWALCNGEYEVPLWLVHLYNNGEKLERLHPGQKIFMPVIGKRKS